MYVLFLDLYLNKQDGKDHTDDFFALLLDVISNLSLTQRILVCTTLIKHEL